MRPRRRTLDLLELPENTLELLSWDAAPRVFDHDLDRDVAGVPEARRLFEIPAHHPDHAPRSVFHCKFVELSSQNVAT